MYDVVCLPIAALRKGAMVFTLEPRTFCCQRYQATSAFQQEWFLTKARAGMIRSLLASAFGSAVRRQLSSEWEILTNALFSSEVGQKSQHQVSYVSSHSIFWL